MNRAKRTEIMCKASRCFLEGLSAKIVDVSKVSVLEEPCTTLVMIKMRENAQKHLFYIGEVLVSECKVSLEDKVGLGILRGSRLVNSYHMAVVDAAYNAELGICEELDELLLMEDKRQRDKKRVDLEDILETKVNFDTVYEEVKS